MPRDLVVSSRSFTCIDHSFTCVALNFTYGDLTFASWLRPSPSLKTPFQVGHSLRSRCPLIIDQLEVGMVSLTKIVGI